MRTLLDAPAFELPPENVEAIRSFLDGQSRIELAVWVRHEQDGADGPAYDHHLVLGVDEADWASGDMRALEHGIEVPPFATSEPTWLDIFPTTEVEALCSFGTVLWKQTTAGGDPLDYRFTYEPFVPDPAAATGFAARLAEHPAIVRAGAWIEKLWKGDRLLEETVQLVVDAPAQADVLTVALDAARESILSGRRSYSASVGRPGEGMPILYEVSG